MIYYIDTVILNFHYFIPINLFLPFQIKQITIKKQTHKQLLLNQFLTW